MRLECPTLRLFASLVLTLLSVSLVLAVNIEDKSNIEDLTAAFNFITDSKKFSDFDQVLTQDVTYDPGDKVPVQGIPATIARLSDIIPNTTTSYFSLGTQLITFLPPFIDIKGEKEKEGSNLAESVSYSTFVGFGSGNLTGDYFILFVKFVDKEIVRTSEPGFGGWRFRNRKFELVVGFSLFNFLTPPYCQDKYHDTFVPCHTHYPRPSHTPQLPLPAPSPPPLFCSNTKKKKKRESMKIKIDNLILTTLHRENQSETVPFWEYRLTEL